MFRTLLLTVLCGGAVTRALEAKPKIVGGYNADQYPSYAIPQGSELCGATLIHEDILLTAAHCKGAFLSGVLIGLTTADGQDATADIAVDREYPHPDYQPGPELNDIMLVKLSSPSSAPLQTLNFDPSLPADGATLTVIGFGNTQTGGVSSFNLLEVQTQAVNYDDCAKNYSAASLQVVQETMFCDKADGKGSCQGDSGGPLFVGQVQVGLVSWGLDCASPTYPGVNTRISAYQDFITQGICDLSSNPPTSCTKAGSSPPSPSSPPTNQTQTDSPASTQTDSPAPVPLPSDPSPPTPTPPSPPSVTPPDSPGSQATDSPATQDDASSFKSGKGSKGKGSKSSKASRDDNADAPFLPNPPSNSTGGQDDFFASGSSKSGKRVNGRSHKGPFDYDAYNSTDSWDDSLYRSGKGDHNRTSHSHKGSFDDYSPDPFGNSTNSYRDSSSKSAKGSKKPSQSQKGPSPDSSPTPSPGNNTSTQQNKLGHDNYNNGITRDNNKNLYADAPDGPLCADGVLSASGRVCCSSACEGRCGGMGCGGLRGRSKACCTRAIRFAGRYCITSSDTGCLIQWQKTKQI